MTENFMTNNQRETLLASSTTVRQANELIASFQPDTLEPNTEADMIFDALAYITEECQNYGLMSTSADPSKCYAISKGLETATVGEVSTVLLHAVNARQIYAMQNNITSHHL